VNSQLQLPSGDRPGKGADVPAHSCYITHAICKLPEGMRMMRIPSALLAHPGRVHADSWSSSSCEWFPCATRSAHPRPSPGSADAVPHIPEQHAQILTTSTGMLRWLHNQTGNLGDSYQLFYLLLLYNHETSTILLNVTASRSAALVGRFGLSKRILRKQSCRG